MSLFGAILRYGLLLLGLDNDVLDTNLSGQLKTQFKKEAGNSVHYFPLLNMVNLLYYIKQLFGDNPLSAP